MLFAVYGVKVEYIWFDISLNSNKYRGTKGNPKIWLTYSQFIQISQTFDGFVHSHSIPFNNFEWFNHVRKGTVAICWVYSL